MTPTQCKMARVALGYRSPRALAERMGTLSHTVINSFERGTGSEYPRAERELEAFFAKNRVFFGPGDGVCLNQNVFDQQRFIEGALWELLRRVGVKPGSADLIEAGEAAERQAKIGPFKITTAPPNSP